MLVQEDIDNLQAKFEECRKVEENKHSMIEVFLRYRKIS